MNEPQADAELKQLRASLIVCCIEEIAPLLGLEFTPSAKESSAEIKGNEEYPLFRAVEIICIASLGQVRTRKAAPASALFGSINMTLVMAGQFGDRLIFLSDSMIADRDAARPNVIPGQLKTIVLNANFAVSYSGLLRPALEVIRNLRAGLTSCTDGQIILDTLREETEKLEARVDFLLGCLVPHPALYKVANGKIYSGSDRYWIGDPAGASAVQRRLDIQADMRVKDDTYFSAAEVAFTLAFYELVSERPIGGIGGVAFNCLGSPLGFCYQNHGGFFGYGAVKIPETPEEQRTRLSLEKSGMGPTYSYSVTSSPARGVAAVGLFLPQAEIGYLYAPLQLDEPIKFHPISLDELTERVTAYSAL